jgi:hypothetical protein
MNINERSKSSEDADLEPSEAQDNIRCRCRCTWTLPDEEGIEVKVSGELAVDVVKQK